MKKVFIKKSLLKNLLLIALFIAIGFKGFGQVAVTVTGNTNTTPNLSTSYVSLASAITALNSVTTFTGPVTLTCAASGTETAPAGGYSISFTGTTTAANNVIIDGAASTITASGSHTAGNLNDAVFKIIGSDYVTIKSFTILENANSTTAASTNNMTEWGIALLYASTTNGAQNCTIQGCTIDMNRTYQNSFGIYSNSTHSATAPTSTATATTTAGGNTGLTIIGNTITDVNLGICVVGPTAAADNNDGLTIGGSLINANTLTNYGTTGTISSYANVSGTVNGILVRNTKNYTISYNSITSSNGGVTAGTVRGIFVPAFSSAPTGTIVNTINNNSVSVKSGLIAGIIQGIVIEGTTANATTTINVNANNFSNFGHTVSGTAAITFISNAGTALTLNISNNTFTNISVNTTGSVTFISHNYSMPAGGIQTIDNNSIVTAFSKTSAGGTVLCTTTGASSPNGSTNVVTNNNFSNITVTGATTLTGIANSDGSGTSPTKTCTGNTFNNWTGGTSTITGITYSYVGATTSSISNNSITSITGQGAITAINIGSIFNGATPLNVSSNAINNLSSTGTGGNVNGIISSNTSATINMNNNTIHTLSSTASSGVINGISFTGGGTTINVHKNKIYNLSGNQTGTTVNGLVITSGTLFNIYNNVIGDLKATAATGLNAINGISGTATATYNVYYNTIYLNATSSSVTTFGSSCVNFTSSTGSSFNLRNNVLINLSVPGSNGSNLASNGVSAVLRRSGGTAATVPANYATTSNNNLFWCDPSAGTNNHATYIEGTATITNAMNTLSLMKAFMANRDQASVSENPTLASTTGSSSQFLEILASSASQAESGAASIVGFSDDFNAAGSRTAGNYPLAAQVNGGGTAPDMGAYEGDYTPSDQTGPSISYTNLSNTASTTNRTLSASISDPSGIPTTGANRPTLYWKINSGTWSAVTGTYTTGTTFTFSFGSGVVAADIVSYYIVAQDLAGTPNVSAYPASGASGLSSGPPTASTPPSSPSTYIIVSTISGAYTIGGDYTGPSIGNAYATLGEASANATPNQIRAIRTSAVGSGYTAPTIVIGASWVASTAYNPGDVVGNAGNWYTCSVSGTSAASGGPTGTSSSITDGSATWAYGGTRATATCVTSGTSPNLQIDGISISGNGSNYSSATPPVLVITDATGSGATFTVVISGGYELGGATSFELSGTYNSTYEKFPVTFEVINGASATNTLTVKPASGITATISGSSATSILKFNGADYVIIDGSNNGTTSRNLTISNSNTGTTSAVVWFGSLSSSKGATNNTIKNCIVTGNAVTTTLMGITFGGNTTISASAMNAAFSNSNNTIQNNLVSLCQIGIYSAGSSASVMDAGLNINSNEVGTATNALNSCGIMVQFASTPSISQNTVQNITGSGSVSAISGSASVHTGIYIRNCTSGTIFRNKVFNVGSSGTFRMSGILHESPSFATIGSPSANLFHNNIIYHIYNAATGNTSWQVAALSTHGGYADKFYYNVAQISHPTGGNIINNIGPFAAFCNGNAIMTTSGTNIDVRNNIFQIIGSSASATFGYTHYTTATSYAGATLNNNRYYNNVTGSGTFSIGYLSSARSTITDWQTATSLEAASSSGDPLLNSISNLVPLIGSPVLAAGTPVSVTTDYNGVTRSVTSPAIGAYETGLDGAAPTITYTALNNVVASSSRTLTSFATITDVSGINTTAGTRPRIYYKKSTDDNTYVGNTSSDNGWKYVESSNTSSPFSFTMDFTILNGGSVSGGQTIQYFVVAQDLASTPNVALAKSGLGFTAAPSSVALAVGQFPLTGTPDQFSIVSALATTLTVGTSGADYTSLSGSGGLFEAINNGILSGNTTVSITSDLSESGANSLNTGGMGGYSLSIQPASATIYNIENSADIAANGMIVLFADNITIDGRFSGAGNYLRFQNTHSVAASAQAAIFVNNCTNITIRNCTIQGNTSGTGNGVVLIGSGTNASVTNVTLLDNIIKEPTTGLNLTSPAIGIFLKSTQCGNITIGNATVGNQIINCTTYGIQVGGNVSTSTIRNNKFYNTTSLSATYYGVYMSAGTAVTIQDNHFYGAGTSGAYSGIYLSSASAINMTISGNYIGGGDVSCGGTAMPISGSGALYPMYVSIGASNNSIQGNTIQNFNITGTNLTYLMYVLGSTGANIGTVTGNVIGHNVTAGSITRNSASGITYGIFGSATGGLNIQNNIVANFDFTATTSTSNLIGIYITGAAVNTVSNNVVHDIFNNSSSTSSTTTQSLIGISLTGASASGAGTLDGNTVYNLTNNYNLANNTSVSGITLGSTSFYGTVQKNKIYGLVNKSTGTAPFLMGLYLYDASITTATTVANNQISLNNTGGGDKCGVWGIRENTATGDILNLWYNSIYIGGTANAATTLISAAIYFQLANTTVSVKNNILYNERTGGTATTGQGNYCLAIDPATGYSISNNLFVSPSDARVGRFGGTAEINVYGFVDFNTNASQTSSVFTTSVINPAATFYTSTSTGNLATSNCWADNAAAAVSVTTDYAGTTRHVTTPDMGALEFTSSVVQWKGATTDWHTNTNWCYSAVPGTSTDIEIPATTNDPILGATANCKNINIASGEILSLNGNTLNIYGAIAGTGTLKGNGSLSISGSGTLGTVYLDQTTPGTTNRLTNLSYDRSGQTLTLGNAVQVTGVVTPTAGTLATGGNLTLISANGADASIAAGSGSYLTGAVTVQRYIPAATSGRKYRYLAAPFASGPSIASSWQQQIHITGAAGVSAPGTPCPTLSAHGNGFDASTYNNGSMLTFNEATATVGSGSSNASGGTIYNNAWTSVANTNSTNLSAGLGYNVFVRGARSQGCGVMDASAPTSPTDVTLSATGTVTTGSFTYTGVTYNASNGDGWNLVGNPYPSAINWDAGSWTKTNVLPTIWIYNPATNGYATYNTSTGGVAGGSNVIPSGAAFFIHATGAPTLALTEAAKTSSYPGTLLLKNKPFDFRLTLSNSNNVKDEHLVALNRTGASDLFDPITDAEKMHNPNNVNIYSIDGANKKYAINALANIQDQEERIVPLGIGAATIGNYQLSIAPVNLPYFYYVFLRDHYLHTEKQVEAGQTLSHSFQVTADSASFRNGRFDLFISNNRPHSTRLGNATAAKFAINVFPNPTLQNVSVTITGEVKNVQALNLYNAMGQLVEQIEHPLATTQIDLGSFPAGMYFIKVISEQVSVETIKLIKN